MGWGKGIFYKTYRRTLTKKLLDEFPHIFGLSISHTTRKPRGNEENGVHYHFVTKQEMEEEIENGSFVETVTLFGHVYGTSFRSIDKVTEEGKICIMDLETEVLFKITNLIRAFYHLKNHI